MNRLLWMTMLFVSVPVCAQDFAPEQVVFPITGFSPDLKYLAPVAIKFGTGFCLDPDCRFVGTNYHVAKIIGTHVRIKGVWSVQRYLGTGADDAEAQETNLVGGRTMRYAPVRDLAIYEMRHPLKHFHGIGFEADDVEKSTEVDIYAYPFNWNPKRGLVGWHCRFVGTNQDGLLMFDCGEGHLHGGASGGIAVDSRTKKIVGILSGMAEGEDRIASAVPIRELSDFVARAQPYLQATLFPKTVFVSPVSPDLYTPYVWPRTQSLSERYPEPPEVYRMRRTAQRMADSMRNFTATETFAWGYGNREPDATAAYETMIADGQQRWRRVGDKKFYNGRVPLPFLDTFLLSGSEWSSLPEMVGTYIDLKIRQAPDAVIGGRTIHVFQYNGGAEDRICPMWFILQDFGFFQWRTGKSYDCHGEVWMDEWGTILRISRAIDLDGDHGWSRFWEVMTYGWVEKDGIQYLVPVTIAAQSERRKTYWCRGLFTDYEMFGVKTRLILSPEPKL